MPTDLTTMTTLDLLRELEARGGMPVNDVGGSFCLESDDEDPCSWGLVDRMTGDGWRYVAKLGEFGWPAFQVALQAHLAGMGVATMCFGSLSSYGCRVFAKDPEHFCDGWHIFGPGVDGLLRAAVGALREVQGATA